MKKSNSSNNRSSTDSFIIGGSNRSVNTHSRRVHENKLGRYESEKEAFNLLVIVIHDIEAFLMLAKEDLCFLPAAEAISRPAFEIATRIVWMLQPNDPFEREARWIAHLKAEENDREKVEKLEKEAGKKPRQNELLTEIRKFREVITEQLIQRGYAPPKKIPNMNDMLNEIGEKNRHIIYIALCQSTHGTHIATWNYRRNLGINEGGGKFIRAIDWYPGFKTVWFSLSIAAKRFLEVMNEDVTECLKPDFEIQMRDTINRLLLTN